MNTKLWYISWDFTNGKSSLDHVMAWCCQATSHYSFQYWPVFMTTYDVTRPHWVQHHLTSLCHNEFNYNGLTSTFSWPCHSNPKRSSFLIEHVSRLQPTCYFNSQSNWKLLESAPNKNIWNLNPWNTNRSHMACMYGTFNRWNANRFHKVSPYTHDVMCLN